MLHGCESWTHAKGAALRAALKRQIIWGEWGKLCQFLHNVLLARRNLIYVLVSVLGCLSSIEFRRNNV